VVPVRHVAPGGGVEFELDPVTGHRAWRVAGRWATVGQARKTAGDGAVDRILRTVVADLRAHAREAEAGERLRLRSLAAELWRGRYGAEDEAAAQSRLF